MVALWHKTDMPWPVRIGGPARRGWLLRGFSITLTATSPYLKVRAAGLVRHEAPH
jgi:hypothetical protein